MIRPAASPFTFTGFKIATALSILIAAAIEIVSPAQGMGNDRSDSSSFGQVDVARAYAMNLGFVTVERRVPA